MPRRASDLAASQVNVHKRIIVVDVSDKRDTPYAFINPQIDLLEGEQETQEGCLSVPGFYELVNARGPDSRPRARPQRRAVRTGSRRHARRCASSTNATTSRASCSSTTCPSLKRQRIRKKLAEATSRRRLTDGTGRIVAAPSRFRRHARVCRRHSGCAARASRRRRRLLPAATTDRTGTQGHALGR